MQVADFPTDNPDFDPDNFAYSCIRYLPTDVENAMGPSWTDPRTGEIINATVLVYNDVVNTIDNWRLVQTAQLDPAARAAQMPDSIVEQTLEYIMHTKWGIPWALCTTWPHRQPSHRLVAFANVHSKAWHHGLDYGLCALQLRGATLRSRCAAYAPRDLGVYDFYAVEWGV